jgi:2-C-methyl-D-erythritol 2,4-cyclodiphosphate synthase
LEFAELPQLAGHSDGDVVAHAIADALLSAVGLGDIGEIFGVDKPENANIAGRKIIHETLKLVREAGFEVNNLAVNIVGERPKVSSRRSEMVAALSELVGAPVNISASSGNGCLPFAKDSISATATVMLSATCPPTCVII